MHTRDFFANVAFRLWKMPFQMQHWSKTAVPEIARGTRKRKSEDVRRENDEGRVIKHKVNLKSKADAICNLLQDLITDWFEVWQ